MTKLVMSLRDDDRRRRMWNRVGAVGLTSSLLAIVIVVMAILQMAP